MQSVVVETWIFYSVKADLVKNFVRRCCISHTSGEKRSCLFREAMLSPCLPFPVHQEEKISFGKKGPARRRRLLPWGGGRKEGKTDGRAHVQEEEGGGGGRAPKVHTTDQFRIGSVQRNQSCLRIKLLRSSGQTDGFGQQPLLPPSPSIGHLG